MPEGVLDIAFNFKDTLRSALPTDAQKFLYLDEKVPLHKEMIVLMLKEPWIVDQFLAIDRETAVKPTRVTGKGAKINEKSIEHEQVRMRKVVARLMEKASEAMKDPTERMKMERNILSDQYGLIWLGAIMSFKQLLMVQSHLVFKPFRFVQLLVHHLLFHVIWYLNIEICEA